MFAEKRLAFREEIKRTHRPIDPQTGYVGSQPIHQIAPAAEGIAHLGHTRLVAAIGRLGGFLCNAACARRVLSLQFGAGFGQPQRRSHPTEPPTGHGIRFRHAIDDSYPALQFGKLRYRLVPPHIVDVFVYFVGYHQYVRAIGQHSSQGSQLVVRINAARRVRWRTEYQGFGARRDGSL